MRKVAFLAAVLTLTVPASQSWKLGEADHWTQQDAQRVLSASPWAQSAPVTFGNAEQQEQAAPPGPSIDVPQAGMAGPHGATDGRWDGGVGRVQHNGPPTLNVTVRWDTALPVRLAMDFTHETAPCSPQQLRDDYVITVLGLVPAGRYNRTDPNPQGTDDSVQTSPTEMLAGVMRYSRLWPKGKPAIRLVDAKVDAATGALHLFFPRAEAISLADKEVNFETRFGSISILKRFRLKDMLYKGQLEL